MCTGERERERKKRGGETLPLEKCHLASLTCKPSRLSSGSKFCARAVTIISTGNLPRIKTTLRLKRERERERNRQNFHLVSMGIQRKNSSREDGEAELTRHI